MRASAPLHVSALILAFVALMAPAGAAAQDLPAGPGQDVLKKKCLSCHHADLIQQQRLSKAAWGREIDKMVRWGAQVDASEKETLSEYLYEERGPALASSHDAAALAAGEAVLQRACLSCHGRDLVDQQQLTRPAWLREVDKMIRWGATVPDADKDALVTFLTSRYGPSAGARQ